MSTNNKKDALLTAVLHAHPGIGKFSSETIKAYNEAGWLKTMCTTLVFHSENRLLKVSLGVFPFLRGALKNRYFSEIPNTKIKIYPFKEVYRILAVKFLSLTRADTVWEWAELSFDKWVARKLNNKVKIVHCYEHAALSTFKKAKALGTFKILEQVSQHFNFYDSVLKTQLTKYPYLKSSYTLTAPHLVEKRNIRKAEELLLADLIICNSTFTKNTLVDAGISEERIIKIPLGFPEIPQGTNIKKKNQHFTFICIGSLSVRKGTHILLEVWKKHFSENPDVTLILAGANSLPDAVLKDLSSNVSIKGFLNKEEVNALYAQADLFVFPTLADGFGMVITEAMANGLPVLSTTNSAGYDLIENEVDGFLIEAGDEEALAKKMLWIVANKSILSKMSTLVVEKARKYQWEDYRKLLIKTLSDSYFSFNKNEY